MATDNQKTRNAIKEAYELQEENSRMRKILKENETRLKNILWQLEKDQVGRLGNYELKKRIISRDVISSEKFRAKWPEVFNRIAKITLKDARAEDCISEEELNEVCSSSETVAWKILFYGQTGGK